MASHFLCLIAHCSHGCVYNAYLLQSLIAESELQKVLKHLDTCRRSRQSCSDHIHVCNKKDFAAEGSSLHHSAMQWGCNSLDHPQRSETEESFVWPRCNVVQSLGFSVPIVLGQGHSCMTGLCMLAQWPCVHMKASMCRSVKASNCRITIKTQPFPDATDATWVSPSQNILSCTVWGSLR